MTWICPAGHANPEEALLCLVCRAPRPLGTRYRSLESVGAWRVVGDSVALYARRIASFLTASVLMFLPQFLFQSWQLQADKVALPAGLLKPLVALALIGLWSTFWGVLVIRLAYDEIGGRWEGIGHAVGRLSASMVVWAIVAHILVSLASGLASLLLVIPGLIVWVKLSLTLPVVVCEGQRPLAAMRRSRRLVKGHGWSVFGAFCLLGLVALAVFAALGVVLWVAQGPGTPVGALVMWWMSGANMAVQAVLWPLWSIVPTLFYASLRPPEGAAPPPGAESYGTMPPAAGEV